MKFKIKDNIFYIILFIILFVLSTSFYIYNNSKKKINVLINDKNVDIEVHKWAEEREDLEKEYTNLFGKDNFLMNDLYNVNTKKNIKVINPEGKEDNIITFSSKVKDFVNSHKLIENIHDNEILSEELTSNISFCNIHENIDSSVEIRENPNIESGKEKILQEGEPKKICTVFAISNEKRYCVGNKILSNGSSRIIEKGTKINKTNTNNNIARKNNCDIDLYDVTNLSIWDKIAFYESGGRWDINTNNGYYGGLQFSKSTWDVASKAVGLDIDYPHQATREQQIKAAEWLQRRCGWGQWPNVSKKLGLI